MGLWTCNSCQWRNEDYRLKCSHCKIRKGAPMVNVSVLVGDLGNEYALAALPRGADSQPVVCA